MEEEEMDRDLTSKGPTRYELFVIVSMAGTISFFAYALLAGASAFDWLCIDNFGGFEFGDYFQHVFFMQDAKHIYVNVSGGWGAFPPLIYLFYNALFHLTSRNGAVYSNWTDFKYSDYALLVFLMYTVFLTLAFLYAIMLWKKQPHYRLMVVCLLLSMPFFAGAYERGNSVMIVVVLLLIALKWRESESKIKRELAMVLIAICAGIKIYPAIFGLLYLKEKRWKETFRLILYGIIFFFGPFFFFLGKDGLLLWLSNVASVFGEDFTGRIEFIKGVFCTVAFLLTGKAYDTFGSSVSIFFLLLMIFLAFLSNNRNRTVFFLCAAMTFFPVRAFRYTLCYFAIPLIMDLAEHGDESANINLNTLETVFYGLIFTIPTYWGVATQFRLSFRDDFRMTYVDFWIYLMAYLLLLVVVVHELVRVLKSKDFNPAFKRMIKVNGR